MAPQNSSAHALLKVLAIAAAYCVTGKLGLLLAIPPGYATALWPPSGIALAALILFGLRYWPGVWLGSFITNFAISAQPTDPTSLSQSMAIAAVIGVGAAVQAAAGAALVKRYIGLPVRLVNEREVFLFLLLGGPAACVINATCGTALLSSLGSIDADDIAHSWSTWWAGDTIGVLIFAPLAIMWFDSKRAWESRRRIVTLSLAVTFAAAVLVFVYASRSEWRSLNETFAEDTRQISSSLRRRIELNAENLRSIANFFAASRSVERDEFQRFTQSTVTSRDDLMGLGWIPKVERAERKAVEGQLPPTALLPHIYDVEDSPVVAPERADYLPVLYYTARGTVDVSGRDFGSDPARRETLERARDSGTLTASPLLTLKLQPGRPRDGFLLAMPIYDRDIPPVLEERRAHLLGYAFGFFRASEFVGHPDVRAVAQERIGFEVTDITDEAETRIFWYGNAGNRTASPVLDARTTMTIGGRRWELHFFPMPGYLGGTSLIAWLVLAGGLLFSALIGAGTLILTGRTSAVEGIVRERTDELGMINEKLSLEVCDHIRTEAALSEERAFLKTVLDHLNEGIVVFDTNGTLTLTNMGARRTIARLAEPAGIESWAEIEKLFLRAGGEAIQPEDQPHRRALNGETVVDFEFTAAARNRKTLTLSINARPLLSAGGERTGAVLFVRDITESRAADRLKREFISVVSHELRTPLTSIRGSLGLVKSGTAGALPPKAQHLIELAHRNCDRLALLINDILDVEKIESGQLSLDLKAQPLDAIVEQSIEANLGYARQCEVHLVLTTRVPGVRVYVDALRLQQVLANLISNASKFSPQGDVVEIGVEMSGSLVRVLVRDRGPGIPAEFQPRLFQKFSQADSSDSRTKAGTGLGLAISKALIERMGGTIGYVTGPQQGTTFYFDLPVVVEEDQRVAHVPHG